MTIKMVNSYESYMWPYVGNAYVINDETVKPFKKMLKLGVVFENEIFRNLVFKELKVH